jgi:hypothetical protein
LPHTPSGYISSFRSVRTSQCSISPIYGLF